MLYVESYSKGKYLLFSFKIALCFMWPCIIDKDHLQNAHANRKMSNESEE